MGRGGFNIKFPNDAQWDDFKSDCSGWVSWLLCMRRDQIHAKKPWSKLLPWIETSMIWRNAQTGTPPFIKLDKPEPGCFVVYPDSLVGQGHVGFVIVATNGNLWGIDCSAGANGPAERNLSFFLKNKKTIFVALKEDLK